MGKAPPTTAEKKTLMDHTVRCLVGRANDLGFLTPDHDIAVGRSNKVFLMVGGSKDVVTCQAKHCDGDGRESGQIDLVIVQVLSLQRVHQWKPYKVAPGEIEAHVIVCNIDGPEIPVLVPEEIDDIQGVQEEHDPHRICHVANIAVLSSGKRDIDHGPSYNARSSIEEQLEIKHLADPRVEFDAHEEVVDDRTSELSIGRV